MKLVYDHLKGREGEIESERERRGEGGREGERERERESERERGEEVNIPVLIDEFLQVTNTTHAACPYLGPSHHMPDLYLSSELTVLSAVAHQELVEHFLSAGLHVDRFLLLFLR